MPNSVLYNILCHLTSPPTYEKRILRAFSTGANGYKKAHTGHGWWSWGLNSGSSFALHGLCLSNNERVYIINFVYNENIACIEKRLQIISVEPGAFLEVENSHATTSQIKN